MNFAARARTGLLAGALALMAAIPAAIPVAAQTAPAAQAGPTVRVVGVVRDESNAITLPGVPVEVVGTSQIIYTDVDGRYIVNLAPGMHQLKVLMEGYREKLVNVSVAAGDRTVTADIGLTLTGFEETVTVTAAAIDVATSSAEAQLIERKNSQVITDNIGSVEMKSNGDSDAAAAMSRVTGLSVVDNQYVFVRGLGERYSNTTLAGSVLPTTEPDKKVVPLDLFPTGLIDSVQVSKSYSPDRSAEFAGGLVQVVPMKLPPSPTLDFSYGISAYTTATGKAIPLSPLGNRDVWGFDSGARALPSAIPANKIVRRGIFTPDVGYSADEITAFGRSLDNTWRPALADGAPGQNWSVTFGNRFDKLGVVASVSHSYKEQFVEEDRGFFRIAGDGQLENTSDYHILTGQQKAQIGAVANIAYQFAPTQRISFENFYTHSGRDEGRTFQGINLDNQREYRNFRVQFIEEGLMANAIGGEHFFQDLGNSRVDWRVNSARATRDEPDLRETLYERLLPQVGTPESTNPFLYADESQSGFRMFNTLADDTVDANFNWSTFQTRSGRPSTSSG